MFKRVIFSWWQPRFGGAELSFGMFTTASVMSGILADWLNSSPPPPHGGIADMLSSFGFTLRWPPAIVSSQLGALRIHSPIELLVGLFELGPVVLFTPWITRWAWRRSRQRPEDWIFLAFILAAWIGFIMPIFLVYSSDRDVTRLAWQGLLIWTLFLTLMVWDQDIQWHVYFRRTAVIGLALMVFGGVVVAGSQLTATTQPMLAYRYDQLDAEMTRAVWGKLPARNQIVGANISQSTVIVGELIGSVFQSVDYPWWVEVNQAPKVDQLVAYDFNFLYVDELYWSELPEESRQSLSDPCVNILAEVWDNSRTHFQIVYDLRDCR
jgi:hypothetical protein